MCQRQRQTQEVAQAGIQFPGKATSEQPSQLVSSDIFNFSIVQEQLLLSPLIKLSGNFVIN